MQPVNHYTFFPPPPLILDEPELNLVPVKDQKQDKAEKN